MMKEEDLMHGNEELEGKQGPPRESIIGKGVQNWESRGTIETFVEKGKFLSTR